MPPCQKLAAVPCLGVRQLRNRKPLTSVMSLQNSVAWLSHSRAQNGGAYRLTSTMRWHVCDVLKTAQSYRIGCHTQVCSCCVARRTWLSKMISFLRDNVEVKSLACDDFELGEILKSTRDVNLGNCNIYASGIIDSRTRHFVVPGTCIEPLSLNFLALTRNLGVIQDL